MEPETKQILIDAHRDIADALEADGGEAYPDFENAVVMIVDDPETEWPDDRLVTEWTISVYDKTYKELRDVAKEIAEARDLQFTTSFIPEDTIKITFIIAPLNQGRKNAG